jgi:hypothetical protein
VESRAFRHLVLPGRIPAAGTRQDQPLDRHGKAILFI